jgi:hypothetical protein
MIRSLPHVSAALIERHIIGIIHGLLMHASFNTNISVGDANLNPAGEWHVPFTALEPENNELSSLVKEAFGL